MSADPTVDELVELCANLARDEVCQIMAGPQHIHIDDLTAPEVVALLTVLRPVRERVRLAQRQPAPVLELVRSGKRARR